MSRDIIAIDIQDADEVSVEGIYDEFCSQGYTLISGYTPDYADVLDEFYDTYGTSPAYMFCYEDDEGYLVIEFTVESSHKAARLLDETELMDFDRALRRYGYGF